MESYDVVVLGTGASGLTAALAAADADASVGLFEKADKVGGTTALASAVAWIPNNKYAAQAGVADSREDALAYLASLSHGMILPELAETLIDTGPELIEWLESSTPLKLRLVPGFPDYHPEHPGGKPQGGRSLEPELFSFDEIPGWGERMVGVTRPMRVTETPIGGGTGVIDPEVEAQRRSRSIEGLGRAMVGALLKGCLNHNVVPQLEHRAVELLMEDGAVRGVRFESPDGVREVRTKSVVIATGGFESDEALVRDFLRGPIKYPAGVATNTGDGLRMAMRVGAQLGNMREAWWVPVAALPKAHPDDRQPVMLILRERTLPRSIMVNRFGKRFTNEAANYNALGGAFHQFDPTSFSYLNQPCWLVFDQGFVERYGGFGAGPGGPAPGWAVRGDSLASLAEKIDVPADQLEKTVARFNELVSSGHDDDFNRGDSAYDGWCGDRTKYPGPMATLGPLDEGPYYAVELVSSALGTKGGPRTDVDGAVLDVDGNVIPGLFAAGNAMAGATGMVYGGAGGTLGPALVFGYRAGRRAAKGC
ncbi:FAD-binding protein [Planosporangium thailandense]|uniref:FAD-binding protein n=1 Tax=Planosporangium thailandense TaxID=765197 RepID=A0ABX0Y118_9ACTN|nr:FAD-dependent oxidoreductase [Planosporangium thailandense]NJC71842.1 FAD-binding protein [Planosporangium thailandense]